MAQLTHESFVRDEVTAPGSDRTFGLVMAGALAVLALFTAGITGACGRGCCSPPRCFWFSDCSDHPCFIRSTVFG
jgi:hypothetical protein